MITSYGVTMEEFPKNGVLINLEDFESDEVSVRQRGDVLTISAEVKEGRSNAAESEGVVKHFSFPPNSTYGFNFENGKLRVWMSK